MKNFLHVVCLMLVALTTNAVRADVFEFPGGEPDPRTLKVQSKVEQLFQRGDFDRAYFIYRNELVPAGDKYAQYMVGFMHMAGMGVDEDPVAASAWYRLAAERGTPQFVAVRDMLVSGLTPEERQRSDRQFLEVRRQYSDLAILLEAIKRGLRDMKAATGSRLSAASSPLTVIELNSTRPKDSAAYYARIEQRVERHLGMLSEIADLPEIETDPNRVDINELERLVDSRLELIRD